MTPGSKGFSVFALFELIRFYSHCLKSAPTMLTQSQRVKMDGDAHLNLKILPMLRNSAPICAIPSVFAYLAPDILFILWHNSPAADL